MRWEIVQSVAQLLCLHPATTTRIQLIVVAATATLWEASGYSDRHCPKLERGLNSVKKSSSPEVFEARTKSFLLLLTRTISWLGDWNPLVLNNPCQLFFVSIMKFDRIEIMNLLKLKKKVHHLLKCLVVNIFILTKYNGTVFFLNVIDFVLLILTF